MIVGMFIGASGTYFFERGFHFSVAALLAVTGIVAGAASTAVLNRRKLNGVGRARTRSNRTQDSAPWNYRPRHGIQRYTQSQGAELGDGVSVVGPIAHFDDIVWFDFPSDSAGTEEPTSFPTPKPYD
jgi:hypothetical protein